jgi:outer membrane immunogenic protein
MDKIRTSLLATAAVVALSTSVYAADMGVPRKAPPPAPPPAPIWSWTGFYVGGHFGVGISRERWSAQGVDFGSALFTTGFTSALRGTNEIGSHNSVGPLGGFQVGYNWQVPNSPWVFGIEGEWSFADLTGDHGTSSNFSTAFREDGGAWVKNSFSAITHADGMFTDFSDASFSTAAFDGTGTVNQNKWGWVVGTGVEFGLWDNWSAKIEYDFLDFGTQNFTMPISGNFTFDGAPNGSGSFNRGFSVNQQIHVVKVGLNYRFWSWGY